jgi:hypothetical protein
MKVSRRQIARAAPQQSAARVCGVLACAALMCAACEPRERCGSDASCVVPSIAVDVCVTPEVSPVEDCALDFGDVTVSTSRVVSISNPSPLDVVFVAAVVDVEGAVAFSVADAGVDVDLAPGATAAVVVDAGPAGTGAAHATLRIASNAENVAIDDGVVEVVLTARAP